MKKALAITAAVTLLLSFASAELTFFAKYRSLFSSEALEAADNAKLPDGIQAEALTQFERELFELGYAMGYDAALKPETTYIVNTSSMKFHLQDCSGIKNMSEKNRMEVTCTRDELIDQGYKPCGTCNP